MEIRGDFDVEELVEGDTYRLVLRGELDLASAPLLREAMTRACDSEASEVLVDIRRLEFIDSTGLRELLAGEVACRRSGSAFRVTRATPRIERVFELAGVADRLAPSRVEDEVEPVPEAGSGPEGAQDR
jgi:anti-anti-sigma factor